MKLPRWMTAEQYIGLVKAFMPDFDRVACAETEDEFCAAVELAVRHCLQKLEDRRKVSVQQTPHCREAGPGRESSR